MFSTSLIKMLVEFLLHIYLLRWTDLVGLFVDVGSYVPYHYHYMIYRLETKV